MMMRLDDPEDAKALSFFVKAVRWLWAAGSWLLAVATITLMVRYPEKAVPFAVMSVVLIVNGFLTKPSAPSSHMSGQPLNDRPWP